VSYEAPPLHGGEGVRYSNILSNQFHEKLFNFSSLFYVMGDFTHGLYIGIGIAIGILLIMGIIMVILYLLKANIDVTMQLGKVNLSVAFST
jgi:hypothetical protein